MPHHRVIIVVIEGSRDVGVGSHVDPITVVNYIRQHLEVRERDQSLAIVLNESFSDRSVARHGASKRRKHQHEDHGHDHKHHRDDGTQTPEGNEIP